MKQENPPELEVEGWLRTLGIELVCQWDVLVFLYWRLTSMLNADHIARLLGLPTGEVVAALESLESLGLVERSRVDQGVRLYRFAAREDHQRGDALDRLLTLADSRAGWLLLSSKLRPSNSPTPNHGRPALHLAEGGAPWLKAI
jgi:hypothetical protein